MAEQFKGTVEIVRPDNEHPTLVLDGARGNLTLGGNGSQGDLMLKAESGLTTLRLDGGDGNIHVGGNGANGDLLMRSADNRATIKLDGANGNVRVGGEGSNGDIFCVSEDNRTTIKLDGKGGNLTLGGNGSNADLHLLDKDNKTRLILDGENGDLTTRGSLRVVDNSDQIVFEIARYTAVLTVGTRANGGDLHIKDAEGRTVLNFASANAVLSVGNEGNEGDVMVRDNAGKVRIHLDGQSGEVRTQGADCAELFSIQERVEPGTVMVISEDGAGLTRSSQAYDTRVAGVISGSGNLTPGIVLGQNLITGQAQPLALVGRVNCKADASFGSIRVGDLLTTSPNPGHAMKAEPGRASGAVIGKALQPLAEGQGDITILVSLQ